MSINTSSGSITHGSIAAISGMANQTVCMWWNMISLAVNEGLCGKWDNPGNVGWWCITTKWDDSNDLYCLKRTDNDPPPASSIYVTDFFTTGTWQFGAFTFSQSDSPDWTAYKGSLTQLATAQTPYGPQDGLGSPDSEAGSPFVVGADARYSTYRDMYVACLGLWNTRLTLGQIQSWQFRPRPMGAQIFAQYGLHGNSTFPNLAGNTSLSGSLYEGSLSVGPHVPIGPPFGNMSIENAIKLASLMPLGLIIRLCDKNPRLNRRQLLKMFRWIR